jgi:hypothetical protein
VSEDEQERAVDAILLLRALVVRAKIESGREHVAGVTVIPTTADAESAGMVRGSPRYNAARDQLLEVMALERDHETDELLGNISLGDPEAFKITHVGLDLLRRTGV